jgi:hypothetical protein
MEHAVEQEMNTDFCPNNNAIDWICFRFKNRIAEPTYRVSRKSPAPIPFSTCSRHEEADLVVFTNILSIILSDSAKTPSPVPEHALDVVKSEVTLYVYNRVFNFITRGKLLISEDVLELPKDPKVARVYIWRIGRVWHSEKEVLLNF